MKIQHFLLAGLCAFVAGCGGGGGGGSDDDDTAANDDDIVVTNDDDDINSKIIDSKGGSISLGNGSIQVPPNAIAENGQATYTLEEIATPPSGLPPEAAPVGKGLELTPEGMIFETPVAVEFLVPEFDPEIEGLALMRFDGTQWEYVGGEVTDQAVRGYTSRFSTWFPVTTSSAWRDNTAHIKFVNNSATNWVNVCIQSYALANPGQYPTSISPQWGVPVAPQGTIGWNSEIGSSVPAGDYQFQYEINRNGQLQGCYRNAPAVSLSPAPYSNPIRINAPNGGEMESGPCDCFQAPTPPIGEGALQFTLTWSPSNADLDLHVFTPLDEEIYFGTPNSGSGGQLDVDDVCENGGPENIFWTSSPPRGTYRVEVDYFGSCGADRVNFSVRVNAGGTILKNVSGSISPGDGRKDALTVSF